MTDMTTTSNASNRAATIAFLDKIQTECQQEARVALEHAIAHLMAQDSCAAMESVSEALRHLGEAVGFKRAATAIREHMDDRS